MNEYIILSNPLFVKSLHKLENADIERAAKAKLERIIEREGDYNGIRRTPEYLEELIAEERYQRAMVVYTAMKHKEAKKNGRI